jgi:hypothetical protein
MLRRVRFEPSRANCEPGLGRVTFHNFGDWQFRTPDSHEIAQYKGPGDSPRQTT